MKTNASGTSDKIQRLDALLSEHHRSLDRRLNELVTRAEGGDARQLGAAWAALETELVRHMDLEEVELMPAFVEEHPDEARVLLAEHGALRSALNEIGMALQLHCLGTEAVADFARRLRAHSAREDAVLYAWAQAHASSTTWNAIQRGLIDLQHRAVCIQQAHELHHGVQRDSRKLLPILFASIASQQFRAANIDQFSGRRKIGGHRRFPSYLIILSVRKRGSLGWLERHGAIGVPTTAQ